MEDKIHVNDKRAFNADGTARQSVSESPQEPPVSSQESSQKDTSQSEGPPFEINFSTFILSLASSVQISLGLIPHPATGKSTPHLASAKQTIDILGIIEQKTKGNLTQEEEIILKQILFELRMQYVDLSQKQKKD